MVALNLYNMSKLHKIYNDIIEIIKKDKTLDTVRSIEKLVESLEKHNEITGTMEQIWLIDSLNEYCLGTLQDEEKIIEYCSKCLYKLNQKNPA
jgi:hypothetical protein